MNILPNFRILFAGVLIFIFNAGDIVAQDNPGLFFREDWKEIPAEFPVTQQHVANENLRLKTYGPGGDSLKKSHHDHIPNDPWYLWSGNADGPWAAAFQHKTRHVDLTGPASVKWQARQSGFHRLHLIIKLANGDWLISDQSDGYASHWREREFVIRDIRWRSLNIEDVKEGNWVSNPELSKVEEVGITDLREGGSSPSSSRLDWIEVYGEPVQNNDK